MPKLRSVCIVVALGVLGACKTTLPRIDQHEFRHIGRVSWSQSATPSISEAALDDSGTLHLTRDVRTNSLSVTVSPARNSKTLSSLQSSQFEIALRLTGDIRSCRDTPILTLPIGTSNQVAATVATVAGGAIVTIHASRLGRDLVLATLLSPGGIEGFLSCGDQVAWISARGLDPRHVYAELWERRMGKHRELYVTSLIELPFHLYRVVVRGADQMETVIFSGHTVVSPWHSAVLSLPMGIDPSSVTLQVAPFLSSPVVFQQLPGGPS